MPARSLTAERIDVHGGPELLLEVRAQPCQHPLLELARALAGDAVAVAELLERQRRLGEPALAEDGLLAPLERGGERLQLLAQEGLELVLLDGDVRPPVDLVGDQIVARARPLSLWSITSSPRLSSTDPAGC